MTAQFIAPYDSLEFLSPFIDGDIGTEWQGVSQSLHMEHERWLQSPLCSHFIVLPLP